MFRSSQPQQPAKKIAWYGFTGVIEPQNVARIAAAMNHAVNTGCDEVYLTLSSPGGYVSDGVFLYNHIRGLPLRVTMHNVGSTSSIAVTCFLAAEQRFCSRHALFMIHPTMLGINAPDMTWDRLDGARNAALADDQRIEDILRERARIPDEVLAARRLRDVHFSPDQALQWGLVQGVREFTLPQGSEIIQI